MSTETFSLDLESLNKLSGILVLFIRTGIFTRTGEVGVCMWVRRNHYAFILYLLEVSTPDSERLLQKIFHSALTVYFHLCARIYAVLFSPNHLTELFKWQTLWLEPIPNKLESNLALCMIPYVGDQDMTNTQIYLERDSNERTQCFRISEAWNLCNFSLINILVCLWN